LRQRADNKSIAKAVETFLIFAKATNICTFNKRFGGQMQEVS